MFNPIIYISIKLNLLKMLFLNSNYKPIILQAMLLFPYSGCAYTDR